ncbi:MAG: nucleotidyltransferase family protein [Stackebrandtia sp.]
MTIAGLVLAAGEGRRLGTVKALVEYRGTTLLDHAVTTLRDGGCDTVHAVLGAKSRLARMAARTEFTPIANAHWNEGIGSSLRLGLSVIDPSFAAIIVILVDQPGISATSVRRVREAHANGAPVAVAVYSGQRGHPVCFDRSMRIDVAAAAKGDIGARGFMKANPDLVTEVDCTGDGEPRDIDTPEDLRWWRARQ